MILVQFTEGQPPAMNCLISGSFDMVYAIHNNISNIRPHEVRAESHEVIMIK